MKGLCRVLILVLLLSVPTASFACHYKDVPDCKYKKEHCCGWNYYDYLKEYYQNIKNNSDPCGWYGNNNNGNNGNNNNNNSYKDEHKKKSSSNKNVLSWLVSSITSWFNW